MISCHLEFEYNMNVQYIQWMDEWMGFLNCPEAVGTAHLVKTNVKDCFQMQFDPDLLSVRTLVKKNFKKMGQSHFFFFESLHQSSQSSVAMLVVYMRNEKR